MTNDEGKPVNRAVKRRGIVAPLAVGTCHETMAQIENADGYVIGTIEGGGIGEDTPSDELAEVLVAAYNKQVKGGERTKHE